MVREGGRPDGATSLTNIGGITDLGRTKTLEQTDSGISCVNARGGEIRSGAGVRNAGHGRLTTGVTERRLALARVARAEGHAERGELQAFSLRQAANTRMFASKSRPSEAGALFRRWRLLANRRIWNATRMPGDRPSAPARHPRPDRQLNARRLRRKRTRRRISSSRIPQNCAGVVQ